MNTLITDMVSAITQAIHKKPYQTNTKHHYVNRLVTSWVINKHNIDISIDTHNRESPYTLHINNKSIPLSLSRLVSRCKTIQRS